MFFLDNLLIRLATSRINPLYALRPSCPAASPSTSPSAGCGPKRLRQLTAPASWAQLGSPRYFGNVHTVLRIMFSCVFSPLLLSVLVVSTLLVVPPLLDRLHSVLLILPRGPPPFIFTTPRGLSRAVDSLLSLHSSSLAHMARNPCPIPPLSCYINPHVWPRQRLGNCGPISLHFCSCAPSLNRSTTSEPAAFSRSLF